MKNIQKYIELFIDERLELESCLRVIEIEVVEER